jgi:MerR family transcriptional regulator, light-induced transcriptional regulator
MIKNPPTPMDDPAPGPAVLSIGEVAAQSGIPVALLRTWEERYGLPRPERAPNGRRRYRMSDCDLLQEVQRWRATGLSVPAAMAQARRSAIPADESIFATCRRRHPGLTLHRLAKPAMLALSRAVEDETLAAALRPLLIGAFQRPRFYESSRSRWSELARTASLAVVLADFSTSRAARQSGPALVKIPAAAAMLREWAIVSYAPDHGVVVSGWELPGPENVPDAERRFEAIWSVDPKVARDAALAAVALLERAHPELARQVSSHLGEGAPAVSNDLRRATRLFDRALDYLVQ